MDGNEQHGITGGWRLLGLGDSGWTFNGVGVKFPTRTTLALAWYLILRGGDIRRAEIVEEFWPDAKPEDGQNQLRVTLSRLKSMLASYPGAPTLIADRFTVRLDIGSIPCSAREYDALLERVEGSSGTDKRNASLDLVRLYTGELLPEIDYPFVVRRRSYYQERYMHYLARLSKHLQRTGDFATAVEILQRSLSIDPMQEELYVLLFSIYAQMDRPLLIEKTILNLIREMEARLGDRPTERLEKTIQLALPPRLRERMNRVLQSQPVTDSRVDIPPVGPYDNVFIPRTSERSDLDSHINNKLSRCIAVSGPPGSGKTRFLYEYWEQNKVDLAMTWVDGSKLRSAEELRNQMIAGAGRLANSDTHQASQGYILLDAFQMATPEWRTVVIDFLTANTEVSVIVTTRSADLPIGWANVPILALTAPLVSMSESACLETQAVKMLFSLMPAAVTSVAETTSTVAYIKTLFTLIDPLPFMIEVVASWLSAMTLQQLIIRLSKDRSALLQAAAERSRDGVIFSDTIRASIKTLSNDAKDVLRLLALYGEPLSTDKIVKVLDLRTDVACREICDSGLVLIQDDGKLVVWSLVGEFVRSTQPTSCRNVLRKMVRIGLISATTCTLSATEVVETALSVDHPNDLLKLLQQLVVTSNSSNINSTKYILERLAPGVLQLDFSTLSKLDVTYLLAMYGLIRNQELQQGLITRLECTQDDYSHTIKIQKEMFNAINGQPVDCATFIDALSTDFTNYATPTITTLLYLGHKRPYPEFTTIASKLWCDSFKSHDDFLTAGIHLIRAMMLEDSHDLTSAITEFRYAQSLLDSVRGKIHASYCLYHLIRIKAFQLSSNLQDELIKYQSVNEPGIVCGIASQLAYSFTDKRPELAIHYLKISNSLYSAHLSNEKTSFATLNRRIELILRDALGDDYIDSQLTSVDVSSTSIGDLCGPLDEYVRQTTLFAQG